MEIVIRDAVPGDEDKIALVICESWRAAYRDILTPEELAPYTDVARRTAQFAKILASGTGETVLLAMEGEAPCGMTACAATRDPDLPGYGEVIAIYTLQAYWDKGVGRRLMDASLAALREQGFAKVMLWAFEANTRARRFYERCGFVFDGTVKDSVFGNAPEVRYQIELK